MPVLAAPVVCSSASAEGSVLPGAMRRRSKERREDWRHGTFSTYVRGCRCDLCRAASREYMRHYRIIVKRILLGRMHDNRLLLLPLLLALSAHAATLVRIQCGGPGGKDAQGNVWQADAYYSGGYAWTAANQPALAAQPIPYQSLRASYGVAPITYVVVLPPTTSGMRQYRLTLKFDEPNKTGPNQRVFSVAVNQAAVVTDLDLFAVAGLLKPYDVPTTVATDAGQIRIDLTASRGNAVISGIQVDDVTPAPPSSAPYERPCEPHWSNPYGGAISDGAIADMGCENVSGGTLRITRITCRSDVAGQVLDVQVFRDGAYQTVLSSPFVCTPERAEGTLIPGASYPDGEILWFFVRIVADANAGSPRAVVASVSAVAIQQ